MVLRALPGVADTGLGVVMLVSLSPFSFPHSSGLLKCFLAASGSKSFPPGAVLPPAPVKVGSALPLPLDFLLSFCGAWSAVRKGVEGAFSLQVEILVHDSTSFSLKSHPES